MSTPEKDDLLYRMGGQTPIGQLMRRLAPPAAPAQVAAAGVGPVAGGGEKMLRERPLHPEANAEGAARHRLVDWGDRLCCAALLAAGLGGAALLGWYVCQMPALR